MMALFDRDLIQEMHDNSLSERVREECREEYTAQANYEAVDKFASEGTFSAEKACDILGVDYTDYEKWKAESAGV